MAITIRQIHPLFVGEVTGVDLRKPLTPEHATTIEDGMNEYGVLVLHGQNISDEQQAAFSRNFGELEVPDGATNITRPEDRRLTPLMADVSNLDRNQKPLAANSRQRLFNLGNRLWHSDSSYRAIPAKFSLLSGRVVPQHGGATQFADMRSAYDALDERSKAEINDLVCEHSLMYSRGRLGFHELSEEEKANFKPVLQALVRVHPATRRRSLYLSAHAGAIVGWSIPEARALLEELTEAATQREYVYTHHWQQYDLVMWDNRRTMHRVRRFNDTADVRDMRRTTVAGDSPTVGQSSTSQANSVRTESPQY
jgi:alpha-ketoglutarate-dependent 2,4-dichlorophenoxyacetate dioxygenase